jgi:transcriptional regulator with XRE-family HTH domain
MTRAKPRAPIPLSEAIRQRLRALRLGRGWTQEELAAVARISGLDWTHDTVKNIEVGSRAIGLEELFLLLLVFQVDEEGFFGQGSSPLELSPAWAVEVGGLTAILDGTIRSEQTTDATERLREVEEERTERALAEKKAATVLGIDVLELKKMARRRWGKSLTRERERRLAEQLQGEQPVTPRRRQALRGHITRSLLEELRAQSMHRTRKGTTR